MFSQYAGDDCIYFDTSSVESVLHAEKFRIKNLPKSNETNLGINTSSDHSVSFNLKNVWHHSNSVDDSMYLRTKSGEDASGIETTQKPTTLPFEETFSVFSDSDCGEPAFPQHISINFTPNDEDNEYQQEKCCKFWQFIECLPQLKHLKVYPQKDQQSSENYHISSENSHSASGSIKSDVKHEEYPTEGACMSKLELINKKGIVAHSLRTKMPQCDCVVSSVSLSEKTQSKELKDVTQRRKKRKPGSCPCTQPTCSCKPSKQPEWISPLKAVVREMEEWDAKHPRSMGPPGRTPALQHCVLYPKRP